MATLDEAPTVAGEIATDDPNYRAKETRPGVFDWELIRASSGGATESPSTYADETQAPNGQFYWNDGHLYIKDSDGDPREIA